MKLKDGFILSEVAGETVVLPMNADMSFNKMITLNETGRVLWEALQQEAQVEDLVEALVSQYEVDRDTAKSHVLRFLDKLRENGFLDE